MNDGLFAAIAAGDMATVKSLLDADPSLVGARHSSGASTILWALYNNQRDLVGELEARGLQLELAEAAALGRLEELREWMRPEDVNTFSQDGYPLLGLAVFFGARDVTRYLLERGADAALAARNATRYTPLHAAVARHDHELVRLLLQHGANPDAVAQGGFTALHSAAASNDRECCELLLTAGANRWAMDDQGRTPAQVAPAGLAGMLA